MLKTKKRFLSKITQKGQATIPVFIRRILQINPSEEIEFIVDENNSVSLQKKAENSDLLAYSSLLSEEWDSQADNLAYNDL